MDPSRCKGNRTLSDPRLAAIPDIHSHAKGEHRPFAEERPIAYSPRMLFLWFYHACRRNAPRFLMVSDHINYLTFEDPGAVHTVRRALKLAHAGDLYGAAETAGVDVAHAAVVGEGLRKGMRFSIGAEVDNDPRARPDAQNIVDAMRPDGIIRSVHFLAIDHPEKGADFQWPYDNPEFVHLFEHVGVERVWELYTEKLFDDVEKLPGHIVGHFYKPAIFGHWPDDAKLEAYEDALLEVAAARGMAIEINTRPLYRTESDILRQKYIDVNTRLMRKAKAKGVGIAIGSDAHSPKDQGGMFDVVLQMLDNADINEIVFPVGGRLARVVLRATKEHLEAQRSPEPVQPGSSITGLSRAELGLPEEIEHAKAPREAKTAHDVGPKKRASGPARTTKKPAAEEAPAKTSSKRSAESAASSAAAKAGKKAAPAAKPEPAKKSEPPAKKAAPVKAAPAKKAAPVKAAAKKAAAPAKAAPAKKAAAVRPAAKKAAAPAKKAAPVKSAAVKKAAPAKKAVAKKAAPAKKAPPKKPATAKKAAPAKAQPAKKAASKPAPKAPAKKAAVAKKPAAKAAKPSKGTTSKKKPTTKRR